jgi:hypothetical protein
MDADISRFVWENPDFVSLFIFCSTGVSPVPRLCLACARKKAGATGKMPGLQEMDLQKWDAPVLFQHI